MNDDNNLVQVIQNNESDKLEKYINKVSDISLLERAVYSVNSLGRNQFIQPIIPDQNLTLLHIAAIYDSLECYILLMKYTKLNTRTLSAASYYPLHYACFHASYEVAIYTLYVDPSIATSEPDGAVHQYLYFTVIGGDPSILNELFRLNVNMNSPKNKRDDVFSKCISCRSVECLKILLDNGGMIYDQYGDTTMQMKAIINNQPEALRLLAHSYNDISFINTQGESVFSLACFYGSVFKSAILEMLKFVGNKSIEPPIKYNCKGVCHWICTLCDLDVANAMLRTQGLKLNRLDNMLKPGIFQLIDKDKTPADTNRIIRLIQLLVDNGFDINVRAPAENGIFKTESVLERFTTCIKPNIAIIKFLISIGANIYALKKGKNQALVDGILQSRNKQLKDIFLKQKQENEGK